MRPFSPASPMEPPISKVPQGLIHLEHREFVEVFGWNDRLNDVFGYLLSEICKAVAGVVLQRTDMTTVWTRRETQAPLSNMQLHVYLGFRIWSGPFEGSIITNL